MVEMKGGPPLSFPREALNGRKSWWSLVAGLLLAAPTDSKG